MKLARRAAALSFVIALSSTACSGGTGDLTDANVDRTEEAISGCPGRAPRPPVCMRTVCFAGDQSWDFTPLSAGTACSGGACDGQGNCVRTAPTPSGPPTFAQILAQYASYDLNGDGRVEINSLKPLFADTAPYATPPNGVVIVFVEPRLVRDEAGNPISGAEMKLWLSILRADIASEGFFPYFVEADVYAGTAHQDGRTVLAMRRFLQSIKATYPLTGALIVGDFPEAGIVHRRLTKEHEGGSLSFWAGIQKTVSNVDYLRLTSEYVSARGEIVLADLDGNWEDRYREARFTVDDFDFLPDNWGSFPSGPGFLPTRYYNQRIKEYEDVFFLDDAQMSAQFERGKWATLGIQSTDEASLEATPADRLLPNRIARPEITVSRINARHVALMPTTDPPIDADGKSILAADGKPQAVRFVTPVVLTWKRDGALERRILTDYIARNHKFRIGGERDKPFRPSAIRADGSGLPSASSWASRLMRASEGFTYATSQEDARMIDYFQWLESPAVLRAIETHADETTTQWPPESVVSNIESVLGGRPWAWVTKEAGAERRLVPSLAERGDRVSFSHYRKLWENRALAGAGQSFFIHAGCDVTKPSHYRDVPYNHPEYGNELGSPYAQYGESLMFYANGLALMGRSKVFYDAPAGFVDAVRSTGRFGAGWNAYFASEAADGSLDERRVPYGPQRTGRTLGRKRSYFWNVLGDFTLRLRY
jgi:hypothetical protein